MRVLPIIILLLVAAAAASAQTAESDVKYRLAQSYERSGDFESAARLYEEVFRKDTANMLLFDALRRSYLQLKRYDDCVALMERVLRRIPNDVSILSQLGSVYILKSDEKRAVQVWERAVAVEPKSESTYRTVAGAVVASRLFDRAISFYERGRSAVGDPNLFAFDVAYLYAITLNYAEATREYLKMIRQNQSQLAYVQARIAAYTARPNGLAAATTVIEGAVSGEPGMIAFRQLLAWIYLEGKRFDKAYAVYKQIDEKTGARGHELFAFAERALHERAYGPARNAYEEIIAAYPNFDLAAQTTFGYAQALEASDSEDDTLRLFGGPNPFPASESKPLFTGAIAAYERVIKEFPVSEQAARSLLRIAILKEERLFDLDGARSSLETLVKTFPQFPAVVTEGTLALGDLLITLGELPEAAKAFQSVAGTGLVLSGPKERASLRLAELDFFNTRFGDALAKLKLCAANPASDVTNDALELQIFIEENMTPDDVPLKEYATAALLQRQQKLSESLEQFRSIFSRRRSTGLADETLINIGDLCAHMGRYPDAVAAYDSLTANFPESISLDRTLMKKARIEELGQKYLPGAIATYQRLLEQFPNSIYAGEARKRIRSLRGDNL
jgi:tetratricopeptide (TPR) repeat protein